MANSEIDLLELIERLRRIGTDTQDCEVKEAGRKLPESLLETISAFANKDGGVIVLGLSERENFSPVPGFDVQRIYSAMMTVGDLMTPVIRMEIDIVPFEGAKVVVAIVPAVEDRPCFITARGAYGGSFIRTGDGDKRLTKYEIDRLREMKGQPRHDLEPVLEATEADLDKGTLKAIVDYNRERYPRYFGTLPAEDILETLGALARVDGVLHPTLAGLLVAGVYPQKFFPRLCVYFTVYPGTTKTVAPGQTTRFIDAAVLNGPIPDILMDAVAMLRRNMKTKSVMEGVLRREVPDYPLVAFREGLINALQHRDYSPGGRASQVQVNLYADRLEILNPGGMFGASSEQCWAKGVSSTRNVCLSRLLELTPAKDSVSGGHFVIENRGTGLLQISDALKAENMPPMKIDDWISALSLTFTKGEKKEAVGRKSFEESLLNQLESQDSLTISDMVGLFGLSRRAITAKVGQMVKEGFLERTEPERSPRQRYRLAK